MRVRLVCGGVITMPIEGAMNAPVIPLVVMSVQMNATFMSILGAFAVQVILMAVMVVRVHIISVPLLGVSFLALLVPHRNAFIEPAFNAFFLNPFLSNPSPPAV